jgi:putative aldouronate transport system permease protein
MVNKNRMWSRIWSYKYMYLFILPALVWYFIFAYIPMYGITLGFKEFHFNKGIWNSPWVGTQYLIQFLSYFDFWKIIKNTLLISFLKLLFGFPAPIILALMLNEVRHKKFKQVVQTVSYLPFFISWVVVMTLFTKILTPNAGPVNDLKVSLFGGDPIFFMGSPFWFYPIVVISFIWKSIGWNSIIYLAAISSINPELYDSAAIDGAGRWKMMLNVTLPSIKPTIGILFILSIGSLMSAGYEQIYLIRQPSNLEVSEILDTYIIQAGIKQAQYSLATVAGFFQAFVALILIVLTNQVSKKTSEVSLW